MAGIEMQDDLVLTVRSGDYDRFLCIQLARSEQRAALYAVTAFNSELGRIAESVSEPLLGHIRLAWWREALEEIIAGQVPRAHPVVQALAGLYPIAPVIFPYLVQMVDTRAADLDPTLLETEAQWRSYLDGTAGHLHYVWALLLAPEEALAKEEEIRHFAQTYAAVGLLRAIPYHHQHGFMRFPREMLEAQGLTDFAPSPALSGFVSSILNAVSAGFVKPAFCHGSLCPLYGLALFAKRRASGINKCNHNIYTYRSPRISAVCWALQVKLFLC